MADKRMITRKVTDDDNFLALSSSAQALYLHLSMSSDDDGFNNQVAVSMFKAHASTQDLQALLEKRFLYQFENGVLVIKHWRMANALRKDRYTPTAFQEELKMLDVKENGAYTIKQNTVGCQTVANWLPDGCQVVANWLPQDISGNVREDYDNKRESERKEINKESNKQTSNINNNRPTLYGTFHNVYLTDSEYEALKNEYPTDYQAKIDRLSNYMETSGKTYARHYSTIVAWANEDKERNKAKPQPKQTTAHFEGERTYSDEDLDNLLKRDRHELQEL